MASIQRPKGTQDILNNDMEQWQHIEALFASTCRQFNFQEVRTPIFESTDLFKRGVGDTTDIVNKEMYSFEKGERNLTLRPEGTAGVVRAFNEHGMNRSPKPVKWYYTGPMFRYERPQAGRQRQFHQAGVELFGSSNPSADVEVIQLAMRFFKRCGLNNLSLEINNIGTSADREAFRQSLREALTPLKESLCTTCQSRLTENPFRMLDCKNDNCQTHYNQPDIQALLQTEWTNEESQTQFSQVLELLDGLNIPYTRNPKLVRGLDYYNNTVFEIMAEGLGAKNTVCGGGRYDSLVKTLGGEDTPAVGWALGMERLLSLTTLQAPPSDFYYITCESHNQALNALQLAQHLQAAYPNARIEMDHSYRKLKKQLDVAHKKGASHALLSDFDQPDKWQIKNLATGEQSLFESAPLST